MPDRTRGEELPQDEQPQDEQTPEEIQEETQDITAEPPRKLHDWERQAARLPPFDIWKDLI